MRAPSGRTRLFCAAVAALLAASGIGAWATLAIRGAAGPGSGRVVAMGLSRFASMTFGAEAAPAVLAASGSEDTEDPDPIRPPDGPPSTVTEYRTPNGWLLRPAGTQIDVQRAPTGLSVSPDNGTIFVVTSGVFNEHLAAIDASTFASTETQVGSLYMGTAADENNNLWASGGFNDRVYQFKYEGPVAGGVRQIGPFPGSPDNGISVIGYPGNMVLAHNEEEGSRLFVVGNLSVPSDYIKEKFPDADGCADSSFCSVVNVIDVTDPDTQTPPVHVAPVGRDAYDIVMNESATKLYVSNWADETNSARAGGKGTVSVVDISDVGKEKEVQVVPVGHHPTGIDIAPNGKKVVVANAADDSISLLTLDHAGKVTKVKKVSVKTVHGAPRGGAPLDVAFGPKSKRFYVLLAGQNAIEMRKGNGHAIARTVEVGTGPNATTLKVPHTYIPTGWYPSALEIAPHPDGEGLRYYVTNLKGIGGGPGLNAQAEPLVGERTQGTVSIIDRPPKGKERSEAFKTWTATVVENNRWAPLFDKKLRDAAEDPCKPAPLPDGSDSFSQIICDASKGKVDSRKLHIVYIVKENKTFDQYFGDIKATIPDADADPTWLLYGEAVTTNQHNLARSYVLSDNFWADSEQSTTGHSWTSAGYATEYNEITWNPEYSEGLRGHRWGGEYQAGGGEANEEIAAQEGELFEPEERLVDLFADDDTNPNGATFRIYSDDVHADTPAAEWRVPLDLWGIGTSAVHHGRDLDFPDEDRANMFLQGKTTSHAWTACNVPCEGPPNPPPDTYGQEIKFSDRDQKKFAFQSWVDDYNACKDGGGSDDKCQREMPNFIYMALPVDHTLGFNPGYPTPASMVADNDKAVGMIVDGIADSPFWKNTLIFILEDDTQAAGDHVDAHRTFLLTTGGLARRYGADGKVSHQAGSFPSVLRTIEVLFGLPTLTIYDRAAAPLHDVIVPSFDKAEEKSTFRAVDPPTPFERNPAGTVLAELSEMLDWRLDMTDPFVLRDLLYHGIRGWPLPQHYYDLLRRTNT